MHKPSAISIVIPTRNRLDSLNRALRSLSLQTCAAAEIIIVDSSDEPLKKEQLGYDFQQLTIIHSKPSVCLQRNIGIEKSASDFIFLCDDDVEIPENYLEILSNHLQKNTADTVVSGLVYERRGNEWHYAEKRKSFLKLLFASTFGLSVWTEINPEDFPKNAIVQKFVSRYLQKGNRIATSGWPIVISYSKPIFRTPIYSLMASLVRAEKIKPVLFETAFYENGIGDNYDVLVGMSSDVAVITDLKVLHHEDKINRVSNKIAYYYRIAALHFILLKHKRFTFSNVVFLTWSLVGNSILFLSKGDWKRFGLNLKLLAGIISGNNIYAKRNAK